MPVTAIIPVLIVEMDGKRRAGPVDRRLLIGRRASNNIVIDDDDVSRFHAWIGRDKKGVFIVDLASRSGTRVDDHLVLERRYLEDGDEIAIGPATLLFTEKAPDDLACESFKPPEAEREFILFDCKCGAPLWAPRASAGRGGKCGHCRRAITVPGDVIVPAMSRTRTAAPVAGVVDPGRPASPRPATAERRCPVCQWAVAPADKTTTCPECGQVYHQDCWTQNEGCAIYGCGQLHALRPASERPVAAPAEDESEEVQSPPPPQPRQGLLLAGSIVAALASILSFGVPSLVVAAIAVHLLRRQQASRSELGAVAVSLLGVVAGLIGSYLWWIGGMRP